MTSTGQATSLLRYTSQAYMQLRHQELVPWSDCLEGMLLLGCYGQGVCGSHADVFAAGGGLAALVESDSCCACAPAAGPVCYQ